MDIIKEYFVWMISKIFRNQTASSVYNGLLEYLNSIIFTWEFEMDENRQKDAQDLRYIFGYEKGYSEAQICQELDIVPPSLLEVMIALIIRAQENILCDLEKVDINQDIFLDMLKSLGLDSMKGSNLSINNKQYIDNIINNLFTHNYSYYGEGGLFIVNNPKADMSNTEIWYQFMWYLNEKLGGKYL